MYSYFNIKGCKHWANDVLWEYNKIFTKKVGIFVKEVEIFSLDEEKEDFEFDDNDYLETINGEEISFEDVKKDGFDYIKISAIDEDEIIREILNLELA